MTNDDEFQSYRPLLFSIAYRMLGTASDAEDVVQDAWIRYASAQPQDLRSSKAWLTTVVTRLCLDRLKSARATREEYVGPWLPEPVLTSTEERPDAMLQRHESVTLAFLVLLETLSPEERAVFLLKEVFDYSHDEIGEMLQMTAANARQLLHRAKEHVADRRPRFSLNPEAERETAKRFVAALTANDASALTDLLAEDVGFWADGGGKVTHGSSSAAWARRSSQPVARSASHRAGAGVGAESVVRDHRRQLRAGACRADRRPAGFDLRAVD